MACEKSRDAIVLQPMAAIKHFFTVEGKAVSVPEIKAIPANDRAELARDIQEYCPDIIVQKKQK